jgi:hypothetical protein
MLLFAEPRSTWAIHVLAGQARVQHGDGWCSVAQGETILLDGGSGARRRLPVDGGGELLVVRVTPVDAAPVDATPD